MYLAALLAAAMVTDIEIHGFSFSSYITPCKGVASLQNLLNIIRHSKFLCHVPSGHNPRKLVKSFIYRDLKVLVQVQIQGGSCQQDEDANKFPNH